MPAGVSGSRTGRPAQRPPPPPPPPGPRSHGLGAAPVPAVICIPPPPAGPCKLGARPASFPARRRPAMDAALGRSSVYGAPSPSRQPLYMLICRRGCRARRCTVDYRCCGISEPTRVTRQSGPPVDNIVTVNAALTYRAGNAHGNNVFV